MSENYQPLSERDKQLIRRIFRPVIDRLALLKELDPEGFEDSRRKLQESLQQATGVCSPSRQVPRE